MVATTPRWPGSSPRPRPARIRSGHATIGRSRRPRTAAKGRLTGATGARAPGHLAGEPPRRGEVAVPDVIHDHSIGVEPPGQCPESFLLPGNPAPWQPRCVALVIKRNDLVGQCLQQRPVIALILNRGYGVGQAAADGKPVGAIIGLSPPAVEDREVEGAVEDRLLSRGAAGLL